MKAGTSVVFTDGMKLRGGPKRLSVVIKQKASLFGLTF